MNEPLALLPLLICLPLAALAPQAHSGELWWERGADRWYYKDDWRGLALSGGRAYTVSVDAPGGAHWGWIFVWGERGYVLHVNERVVAKNIDGSLVGTHRFALEDRPGKVTLRIDGPRICAEGEVVARDGKRLAFATGEGWQTDRGRQPKATVVRPAPSTGAYHRARNATLDAFNDEERGKAAIAKCLARVQKLTEQGIFLMRRVRPAEEILSFDPNSPWRRAEALAAPLLEKAKSMLKRKAIPAQKAGQFAEAIAAARDAAELISAAEAPVAAATDLYNAQREAVHLRNCAALIGERALELQEQLDELTRAADQARSAHSLGDWPSCGKAVQRGAQLARAIRHRLASLGRATFGALVGGIGSLDEFPEDRFGWLNARELMGNHPLEWPFSVAPSSCACIDLVGQWQFRVDPGNAGEKAGWHRPDAQTEGWTTIFAPRPWERQGFTKDNPNSPGDCPYSGRDRRCGDKPYNGFAWYRKDVFVPAAWRDSKVMLATGRIVNWGRVFVNGRPLGEGTQGGPGGRPLAADLLRFGERNTIAVQAYNHDNFGGMLSGPLALFVEGSLPHVVETPGPLSYAYEAAYKTPNGPAHATFFASAMSPAVVVATEQPTLELWGWEAKGYRPPPVAELVTADAVQSVELAGAKPIAPDGSVLSENWIHLAGSEREVLVVLERRPQRVAWGKNALGSMGLTISYGQPGTRTVILVMQPGAKLNHDACRFWARALRRYPVAASQMVRHDDSLRRARMNGCSIRYHYVELGGFGAEPLTVAPLPMLLSYGSRHGYPRLRVRPAAGRGRPKRSDFESGYGAPYVVDVKTDTIRYRAEPMDRSKVMKGVGELFAKHTAAQNARGGLSEEVMFRRMGEWGFDHCRYAWAFHAKWDLPLVEFMGGPILEDNEAMWKRLDELVDKCNAAGMQMMLCWFFNEDQPQKDVGGAVRNSTRYWRARPETRRNAFELWRRIAARYADRPDWAISYDFFNEPAYINTDHWNEIMQELTATIRSVDKKHLIVWESADGWAQPFWCLWMKPVDDDNVLYSFHHYGKHWGYAYDEYYPSYKATRERTQIDPWLEAILFSIRHNVPIHCGEFGLSMIQPDGDGEAWLNDYLAFFERFGIGWNWWNYSGRDIYRTGLAAGDRISPYVPILRKWMARSGWGASRRKAAAR